MNWYERAACRGMDPAFFFSEDPARVRKAKAVCAGCPVRAECVTAAIDGNEGEGVWGGLDPGERKRARRKRRQSASPSSPTPPLSQCPYCPQTFDVPQAVGTHVRHRHKDRGIPHGTQSRYSHGCRCEECRAAHRAQAQHWRQSKRKAS